MNTSAPSRTLDDLPHPPGLPLFGNVLAMQPQQRRVRFHHRDKAA